MTLLLMGSALMKVLVKNLIIIAVIVVGFGLGVFGMKRYEAGYGKQYKVLSIVGLVIALAAVVFWLVTGFV